MQYNLLQYGDIQYNLMQYGVDQIDYIVIQSTLGGVKKIFN